MQTYILDNLARSVAETDGLVLSKLCSKWCCSIVGYFVSFFLVREQSKKLTVVCSAFGFSILPPDSLADWLATIVSIYPLAPFSISVGKLTLASISDLSALEISPSGGAIWIYFLPWSFFVFPLTSELEVVEIEEWTTSRWALYTKACRSAPDSPLVFVASFGRSTSGDRDNVEITAFKIWC